MGDNNAQGQILVKVSVNSAEALTNLKLFVTQSNATMQVIKAPLSEVNNGFGGLLDLVGKNRMAMMEFGHVARASLDGLAAGMAPTRIAMMETPRILQAMTTMGLSLATLGTVLGVVALAAGAGYLVWREYTKSEREAEKAAKDLQTQMIDTVKTFKELVDLQKAGLLSPQAVNQYTDILTGKKQLYKRTDGSFTFDQEKHTTSAYVPSAAVGYGISTGGTTVTGTTENQKATALEAIKYVQDQITVQGKLTDSMTEASVKREKQIQDMANESGNENEKEKQHIHDRYQAERDELRATEIAMGSLLTAKKKEADDALIAQSYQDEANDKTAVDMRRQAKEKTEAEQAFRATQAEFAKQYSELNAENEHAITQAVAEGTMNRTEQIQYEYQRRMDFEMSMALQGISTEEQYTKAVTEASAERAKAIKAENLEKEKALDIADEQQRREKQRQIEQSQYMTDAQKYNALNVGGFTDKSTRGADPNSFQDQFLSQMVHIQNQWGTMSQQMGKIFSSNLTTAINATSQAFTKLIMGTMTWKQALQSIESSILNELINAIIKMFEQWIIGLILQYTVGKALAAAGLAADAGIAAGQSAIWATPATLATIASYGGAAYSAPGIISSATLETMASVAGRQYGGHVRAGEVYEIGENRQSEFFVPEENGYVSPYAPRTSTATNQPDANADDKAVELHVHSWPDERAAIKYQRDNPTSRHIMLGQMKRYGKEYRPK